MGMHVSIHDAPDELKISNAHLPVKVGNNVVTVWLTESYCRYFTKDDLPDYLKERLAMIGLCHTNYSRDDIDYASAPNEMLMFGAYMDSKEMRPEALSDVGWRVNDKYYYVTVTGQEYLSLLGSDKEKLGDTRSKG